MGGVVTDPSGKIVSVAAFQLKIANQNNKPNTDSSSKDGYVEAWEKAAIGVVNNVRSLCFESSNYTRFRENPCKSLGASLFRHYGTVLQREKVFCFGRLLACLLL